MKAFFSKALVLIASMLPLAGADFIRQIQIIEGTTVIYDIPISNDAGTVNSQPLNGEVSTFQLYTSVTDANNGQKLVKLDEKVIGTYMPTAQVEILSADPFVPARTRADQPYGIRVTVQGMQTGPDVPTYAKSLRMSRSYALYDLVNYAPKGDKGEYNNGITLVQNGTYVDNAILQRLPVEMPTKAVGEESFTIHTQTSSGAPQSQVAKATVQIWPVATATISGIEPGQVYAAIPTQGTVMVNDIYPGARIYAQIYKGKEALGTVGTVIPSTVVSYSEKTKVPQNQALALSDMGVGVGDDGDYTVEVLTITPFNQGAPERLAYVTFKVKRSIRLNATITTME